MLVRSSFLLWLILCPQGQPKKIPSNQEVVMRFSKNYDIDGLHSVMAGFFAQTERNPNSAQVQSKLSPGVIKKGAGLNYTTRYKLEHDLEQAKYLSQHLEEKWQADIFGTYVIPIYKQVLKGLPSEEELAPSRGIYKFGNTDFDKGIASIYNKALHVTDFSENLHDEEGNPVSLLNQNLDTELIQRQWFGEETDSHRGAPGVVVVDNLLSPEALERCRQVMMESTVWYETKSMKEGGYVGAYIDDGLYDRILIAVGFELQKALPRIMKGNPMRYLWAYKYDERYQGINVHADTAAINVNIWLTPDSANLDANSGGLVVYTVKPPEEWDFQNYNNNWDLIKKELLEPANYANITVPYKQNRAVIFDSALFHKTDEFRFKAGYENRRINLTILYGNMQKAKSAKEELN